MPSESAKTSYASPNKKLWVYGTLLLIAIAAMAYYGLLNQKDRSTNHDYYRVLYEASNTFNENLLKLDSMHRYKENISSIRSLLPSYSRTQTPENVRLSAKTFEYKIVGQTIQVSSPESPKFSAGLAFEDILPVPKSGFSQYLFADKDGQVLARVGSERTISVVELSSINQQIQRKNKQFQFNFSESKENVSSNTPPPLPSYSNHVDMKISYGDFRVYVFPFALSTPLEQSAITETKTNKPAELDRIFLVGLLPQNKLDSRSSGHWNVSLLIVTVISLFFMWCLLRLFLLPKNQSITRSYRVFTSASSYLFYIVIISLLLAYFQKVLLQIDKDKSASNYANQLTYALNQDIQDVFTELSRYRNFYHHILDGLAKLESNNSQYTNLSSKQKSDFNQYIKKAILSLHPSPCVEGKVISRLPGKVGTQFSTRDIDYTCQLPPTDPNFMDFQLSEFSMNVMLTAYQSNEAGIDTLDFYSDNQIINLRKGESLETSINKDFIQNEKHKILSVFALNREGNSVLPSMNFQESNSLPETFNLSHRDYYKLVRDQKGWDLTFDSNKNNTGKIKQFDNVYMQRLLNVNNGTRGTTISIPIGKPTDTQSNTRDYIIGADVMLPSMSLGQSPPFDFVYMAVDRSTGNVLFHNDSDRSLVENIYYSGDVSSPLSKWLKAGLDQYPELGSDLIAGTYHGQEGRFAVSNTVVDNWAIVVFYPNDSLQTFMTNQFLYVATTFSLIILLMVIIIYTVRHFIWTSSLKKKLKLPTRLNVRLVMLVCSVLFSASYSLYIVGANIEFLIAHQSDFQWSLWLPIFGMLLATLVVYRGCFNHFCYPVNRITVADQKAARTGAKSLILVILFAVSGHFVYLQNTAGAPQKSLDFHYQQLSCNWLNYERSELVSIGLSRYPNSITSTRIPPINLLPLRTDWRNTLNDKTNECARHSNNVHPDDYPKLSSAFGTTYMWQWINIYLLNKELAAPYQALMLPNGSVELDGSKSAELLFTTLFYIVLISFTIFLWFKFNTRVMWNRLYCPERFLQHIHRMTRSVNTLEYEQRSQNLKIECDTIKLNGIGLAILIRTMTYNKQGQTANLLKGFDQLYAMSPCLQKFSKDNCFLPNLKLNLVQSSQSGKLNVEMWDIETCLEKSEFRQLLLDLIMELKSLTLSEQIDSFTIFAGFHSLQRVKMKDPMMLDQSSLLDHSEYLSWAECLMDFIVVVPDSFKQGIDWQLLHDEVKAFPELQFLQQEFEAPKENNSWSNVWKRDDDLFLESRWATINYILLNAEALYRFKWESCSSAEKLALLNLAKRQKLNPANTQMIEHLTLNGLITVRKGNLDLINKSFAHFVLHAETNDMLNQLVEQGEAGIWKNYKLPLGVMILLIIGGIALTSGESIYIIAASMAGVLGTIASVTNSANLLRGQMKE